MNVGFARACAAVVPIAVHRRANRNDYAKACKGPMELAKFPSAQ